MEIYDIAVVPVDEAEYVVVDVETTGLSPKYNSIIEIGLVKVKDLRIVESFSSFVNPQRDIPYYITRLTGISNKDVYDAPFFENIAPKIAEFISGNILSGHNLSFDASFLRKEFEYCGMQKVSALSVCTLKIARRMYPMLKTKSLGSVCHHLGIHNKMAHRALDDATVTAQVLIRMIKNLKSEYGILNVNDLVGFQKVPKKTYASVKVKKKVDQAVIALPHSPGVYYFLNSKNDIIYIGKAKSLRERVGSYFSQSSPHKAKKIITQASNLKVHITNTELTALLTEAELIKIINPKHNTLLKKYGNKYFIKINKQHPFPSIEICNYFDMDGNDYFGLFISRRKADEVFEMITKAFALRECKEAEFLKKKRCFLADIERCTAPCVNNDTTLYSEELNKVYEFLCGKNNVALNRLIGKMKDLSALLKFEKAAEVKNLIDLILAQTHKSSLLSEPVNSANVLIEIEGPFGSDYLLMLTGKIFVKNYFVKEKDKFEEAVEDYYSNTMFYDYNPDIEDLEKIKITLNWIIKNRNNVKIFYLKDYTSKDELYSMLSKNKYTYNYPSESVFDIKEIYKDRLEELKA